jgi:hypothetical protein
MHTRTYADALVRGMASKFVWVLVDPSVSTANEDLKQVYAEKVATELGEILALPTALFLEKDGKLVRAAAGMVEAKDFVKIMKEVAGE